MVKILTETMWRLANTKTAYGWASRSKECMKKDYKAIAKELWIYSEDYIKQQMDQLGTWLAYQLKPLKKSMNL